MKTVITLICTLLFSLVGKAQYINIDAVDQPAAEVFRSIVEQTDYNFVYSSDLLKETKITLHAENKTLKDVLRNLFLDTDITYKIKGKNIILKRRKKIRKQPATQVSPPQHKLRYDSTNMLAELVVVSRLQAPAVETPEIGARKITADEIRNIPALFGESDVIKALHTQPGVNEGTEGMAGMIVHGGAADENLYMLDNVPLYQVNHFAGLFSAFNTDIINYIDFFKTSMPAKYDGRLSSFMDVRLRNSHDGGLHGRARLGLTSGAFSVSGPIKENTSYIVGIRRSWYDILTAPFIAIYNSTTTDEKIRAGYSFMDLNAKISHRFSPKLNGFVSVYYGNDRLKTGSETKYDENVAGWYDSDRYNFSWGNFVAQAAVNYRFRNNLSAEFTAAYTRYFSSMKYDSQTSIIMAESESKQRSLLNSDNNISDLILRSDFDWKANSDSHIRFGANYTRHIFLPERYSRLYQYEETSTTWSDMAHHYRANEFGAYIEDEWTITPAVCTNIGFHGSLFYIDRHLHGGFSPRLSLNFRMTKNMALKAAYSHTVQYVHQLAQTYLSLPTDQWIPISGNFKPQTADKIAIGAYWTSPDKSYGISAEAYYKYMHNLIDYRDEYYLLPPLDIWNDRLTSGKGSAKGIDVKFEKTIGKFTGHLSYSLAWADRTFKEKNGGRTFPSRFDNRHTINIVANWKINDKVQLNATWTGHSGNRFTLLYQIWVGPDFDNRYADDEIPMKAPVNNYSLPFYHRLDLACNVRNSRGYWTFGLYNAYCHMNTIGIRRSFSTETKYPPEGGICIESRPVFQKIKLLPIIPSISYTWEF